MESSTSGSLAPRDAPPRVSKVLVPEPRFGNRWFPLALPRKFNRIHQLSRFATGIRCALPDFAIVGAQKGGTTSAFEYLLQHPQIASAARKEVHFFDQPGYRARGEPWYRSFFPTQAYMNLRASRLGRKVVTGEATPYMPYPLVPKAMAAMMPGLRLVFLLRDPVERAFSHYMHNRNGEWDVESLSFSDAIRCEADRTEDDLERLKMDEWHDDLRHRTYNYVRSGLYGEHLSVWLDAFPREQMLIVESASLFAWPQEVMRRITDFLGLQPFAFDCTVVHNSGSYRDRMKPEDRAYLGEQFAADFTRLQGLLGPSFGKSWSIAPTADSEAPVVGSPFRSDRISDRPPLSASQG